MKNNLFNLIKDKKLLKKICITTSSTLVVGAMSLKIFAILPLLDSKSVKLQDSLIVQRQGNYMEIVKPSSGPGFQTYLKKTTSDVEAYCMEHVKPAPDNTRYTRGSKILDEGMKHILLSDPGAGTVRKNYYIKQLALNYYQGDVDWITKTVTKGVDFRDRAVEIAEEAKKVQNGQIQSQYDIVSNIDLTSNNINMTLVNDYYESDWFNVTFSKNLNSYRVLLSGAPAGTQIVNSNGKVVTTLSPSDNKFKIRVHKSKVDKSYRNIKVSLEGNFTELQPYRYIPDDTRYQILALMDSIDINSNSQSISSVNLIAVGDIKVIKSSNRGDRIQGVVFELKKNNVVVATGTTNGNGEIVFRDLEKGAYVLEEKQAPNGFILNGAPMPVNVQDSVEVTVNVPNNVIQGRIAVEKLDSEKNEIKLKGAKFTIYNDRNQVVDTITTNENGYAESKLLDYGTYIMRETTPPEGYHSRNNKEYTINIHENNKTYKYTIYNDVFKGKIQIVKIDSNNEEKPVKGAGFDIIVENVRGLTKGEVLEHIVTDNDGFAFTSELRYGVYKIKETKTPTGFWHSDKDYFIDIKEDGKTYVRYIKNDAIQSKIRVIKTDGISKVVLDGVSFKIKDKDADKDMVFKEYVGGKLLDKTVFTTNSYGEFITPQDLPIGNYQLIEVKTKEGYVLGEPIDFTIDENTPMEDIQLIGRITALEAVNQRVKGDLVISKVDKYTKKPIKGVEFKVECIDGFRKGTIYTGFTSANGKLTFKDLEYGTYKITETKTVPGYVLNRDTTTINISKNKEVVEVEIENKPIEGYIEINKTDKETGRKLEGTKFDIIDNTSNKVVSTIVTDENGYAKSEKLVYGKYTVKEVQPSEGYTINDEIHQVFIAEEEKSYPINMENQRQEGSLEFSKIDSMTKELLHSAKLEIVGIDEINKDIKVNFESTEDITKMILPVGRYEVREINSPEYYVLNTIPLDFTIVNEETTSVVFENKPVEGYIEINKFDTDTNRKLSGAQFEIRDKNRELKQVLLTDENGYAKSEKLPFGVYYVIEVTSPDGYLIDEDVAHKVEVKEEEKVYTLNIGNSRKEGELSFSKKDFASGEIVEGATIEIKGLDEINKDINIVFISKKEGNEIVLPVGKYEIKETIAPKGYIFNEEIGEFEIKENGEITKAQIKNKKIKKVDSATGSLDKPLTGDNDVLIIGMLGVLISVLSLVIVNKNKYRK